MKVFLDVNIIFDYLLLREKFQHAVDILTLIERGAVEAYVDVHTFTYAFFHLKKVLDSSVECKEAIEQLSRMVNVVGGDGRILQKALDQQIPADLEHGFQLQLALHCGVDVIISNDKGFKSPLIDFMSSTEFLEAWLAGRFKK